MSAAIDIPLPGVLVTYPVGTLHVGVTGTREAVAYPQAQALMAEMKQLYWSAVPGGVVGHHGCCTGTDATFHWICRTLHWQRHGHPGVDMDGLSPHRATSVMASLDYCEPELPYRTRNRNILSWSHILLACPLHPEDHEKSWRSGTWQTVRMARDQLIPIVIIDRDGNITKENS